MGTSKISTVKSLQTEYARLMEEKKEAYGEYRKARGEMRNLLTVKATVDRLLGMEEQETGKNKKHGER